MKVIKKNWRCYREVVELLKETTLRYIKHNWKYKKLTITFFVRDKADIFMSHGLADKNYHTAHDTLDRFKLILVPGPWLKNKLVNLHGIHESKIACVGWPKLDPLFDTESKINTETKTILWVPTHDQAESYADHPISSYPKLNEYMELLKSIENVNIVTSTHPRNRKDKEPTSNQLLNCDYVIADAGTTVYEAWALKKPVIFPDWICKKNIKRSLKTSAEEYIYDNNLGYHANDIDELVNYIKDDLFIEDDVTEFMEEYLPSKFNGIGGKLVFDEVDRFFF